MTEEEQVLQVIRTQVRIQHWQALPEHPFREKMIAREQAILARLEAQKEAA